MKQLTLKEPNQIHLIFRCYRSHPPVGWWFRGQADAAWLLIPKAGRQDYCLSNGRDIGRFNHWRKDAIAYFERLPENVWECLALAQHHGLATRLLDWSFNPLVATYFTCCEIPEADGAVYLYDPIKFVKEDVLTIDDAPTGSVFIPRAIAARILQQKGAFTVHNPPSEAIPLGPHSVLEGEDNQLKIVIPCEMKKELLLILDDYGINRVTLFPGLDGWSSHVNWETLVMVQNRKDKM
jgi:hypothetical protein